MPKYDVAKVTEALLLVKAGELSQAEIAQRCGIGLSSLQRYADRYRKGDLPGVDVGELPPPRATSPARPRSPKGPPLKEASLDRILAERGAVMEREAEDMEAQAAEHSKMAERMAAQAKVLREAAEVLRKGE